MNQQLLIPTITKLVASLALTIFTGSASPLSASTLPPPAAPTEQAEGAAPRSVPRPGPRGAVQLAPETTDIALNPHTTNSDQNATMLPQHLEALQSGALSAGQYHTCGLSISNGVRCWGDNSVGELGDGTYTTRLTPVDVVGLTSGIKAIANGATHTCALSFGGAVKCWGFNTSGQLGASSNSQTTNIPVDVTGLSSGVTSIASGKAHSCAVTAAGGVKCWGDNPFGQLGNNTKTNANAPVDVSGISSGAVAVSAGRDHSCALMSNGSVKCWGDNFSGQLGNGAFSAESLVPVNVQGLSGVTALASGGWHNCAVTSAGGAKCWGNNSFYQLGNNSDISANTPVDVSGLGSGVGAVSVHFSHSCALLNNGSVRCWGDGEFGKLGDGTTFPRTTPVAVARLNNDITAIATGATYTCALTQAGKVKCWGSNTLGQLGDGNQRLRTLPFQVIGLSTDVLSVAAGNLHACALLNGGTVKCWGDNTYGQLGNATQTSSSTPVAVTGLSDVAALGAGWYHTCALLTSGQVKCWGNNTYGQLGNATQTSSLTPVTVTGLSNAAQLSLGAAHSCAVTTNGAARCWGDNNYGQLGDGTYNMRLTPTQVSGLGSGAQHIGTGDDFTCAVVSGGVKCWGRNNGGQLGDGTQTRRLTPVNVTGLSNISTVAAGELHACALSTSGGVKCWGYNYYGQVGDGTRNSRFTPVDMADATSGVKAISAGGSTTCLVDSADNVQCLGHGGYGEMGNGDTTILNTSLQAARNLPAATEVRVGQLFVCAAAGGAAYCWGSNDMGQTGDGSPLIFGLVDTFGIFLPTAVQAINYDLVIPQGLVSIVIDVSKNYGAPGTLISNTQPLHGSVSCTSVGLCTYTPTVGYAGPDNFLYTLSFGTAQGSNLAAPEAPAAFQVTGQAKVLVATKFVFLPTILR